VTTCDNRKDGSNDGFPRVLGDLHLGLGATGSYSNPCLRFEAMRHGCEYEPVAPIFLFKNWGSKIFCRVSVEISERSRFSRREAHRANRCAAPRGAEARPTLPD